MDFLEMLTWQNPFEDMFYEEYFCICDMLRMVFTFYVTITF